MPAITVKIERDEQGQYSVGTDTAGQGDSIESLMQPEQMPGKMQPGQMQQEGTGDTGMQPAADLEDALSQARTLLAEPQTEQQAFAQA